MRSSGPGSTNSDSGNVIQKQAQSLLREWLSDDRAPDGEGSASRRNPLPQASRRVSDPKIPAAIREAVSRDPADSKAFLEALFCPPSWHHSTSGGGVNVKPAPAKVIYFSPVDQQTYVWHRDPEVNSNSTTSAGITQRAGAAQKGQSRPAASPGTTREVSSFGLSPEELAYFGIDAPANPSSSSTSKGGQGSSQAVAGLDKYQLAKRNLLHAFEIPKEGHAQVPQTAATTAAVAVAPAASSPSPMAKESTEAVSSPPESASQRSRRKSFLHENEKPINKRFENGICDATKVRTCVHLLAITKAAMSTTTAQRAGRDLNQPVVCVDISGTRLGKQGMSLVPTSFDEEGEPIRASFAQAIVDIVKKRREPMCFWPDERNVLLSAKVAATAMMESRNRGASPERGPVIPADVDEVLTKIAERSLCLAYVAPLMYVSHPTMLRVTKFVARDCDLTDADAVGIATILAAPFGNERNGTHYECLLEVVDLGRNYITDDGADALKKSIKYNTTLRELNLADNRVRNGSGVLNEIKKRLRNNRMGISNLGTLATLKRRL